MVGACRQRVAFISSSYQRWLPQSIALLRDSRKEQTIGLLAHQIRLSNPPTIPFYTHRPRHNGEIPFPYEKPT